LIDFEIIKSPPCQSIQMDAPGCQLCGIIVFAEYIVLNFGEIPVRWHKSILI